MRAGRGCRGSLHRDVLVLVALQVACGLGLLAQTLHGAHHIIRLGQKRIPQALHPHRVLPENHQYLRERHQCLDTRVPGLRRHLFDSLIPLSLGIGLGPRHCFGHFTGIGGGHQYLCQQRVGIQRNRREHLVQLLGVEYRLLGGCRLGGRRRLLRLDQAWFTTQAKQQRHGT